jgi:hypothetical protein
MNMTDPDFLTMMLVTGHTAYLWSDRMKEIFIFKPIWRCVIFTCTVSALET